MINRFFQTDCGIARFCVLSARVRCVYYGHATGRSSLNEGVVWRRDVRPVQPCQVKILWCIPVHIRLHSLRADLRTGSCCSAIDVAVTWSCGRRSSAKRAAE